MDVQYVAGKGIEIATPANDSEAFIYELLSKGYFKGTTTFVLGLRRDDAATSVVFSGDKLAAVAVANYLNFVVCTRYSESEAD